LIALFAFLEKLFKRGAAMNWWKEEQEKKE